MKRACGPSTLAALTLLASAATHVVAQTLTMEEVMTRNELVATGIATLTAAQRKALDDWLNRYTIRVLSIAQTDPSGKYYSMLGSGHWIRKTESGGSLVTLEDGSLWEISSVDRVYTALWLPITSITVLEADYPVGEYRYLLINTDDGEKALAKYLGKE